MKPGGHFKHAFSALFGGQDSGTADTAVEADSRFFQASAWPDFITHDPGRPVRVVLIDDDPCIRRVIAGELVSDMRIDLVGQADSLREGKRLIARSDFDVMIVDINLGDGAGFELLDRMKATRPHAEAIVISVMDEEERALQAFELGATGYLVKNSWFGSFVQAVLQVYGGGASITPNLARRLLHRLEQPVTRRVPQGGVTNEPTREALSARERDVLRLVALGHTSAEIAGQLALSVQTVNTHIRNIYRKLQVKSRVQAVNMATHHRLL